MGLEPGPSSQPVYRKLETTTPPSEACHVSSPAEPPPRPSSTSVPSSPPHSRGTSWSPFEAPVTSAFLAPFSAALSNTQRWTEEPFPFAWFLTPLPDVIPPDSIVFIAGYSTNGGEAAKKVPEDSESVRAVDTPEAAARRTVAMGAALCFMGVLSIMFPSILTLVALRIGGACLFVTACLMIFLSLPSSIPDFIVGLNVAILSLLLIYFQGFGGFLVAAFFASWLFLKGLYRGCPCFSALVGTAIVMTSFFTSSVVGFLLGYDVLLCGMRVFATGQQLGRADPSPGP